MNKFSQPFGRCDDPISYVTAPRIKSASTVSLTSSHCLMLFALAVRFASLKQALKQAFFSKLHPTDGKAADECQTCDLIRVAMSFNT